MLTALVFLPLVGALAIVVVARGDQNIRLTAVAVALADLVLAVVIFARFDTDAPERFQFIDRFEWISSTAFTAQYQMGVDGLSAPLVTLTGLLGLCAVLASWHIKFRVREHFFWLLILQTAVMGVFSSLDLLLFFLFWEVELIPMYFLITVWGSGRKEYSALKFLLFTAGSSALMLISTRRDLGRGGDPQSVEDSIECPAFITGESAAAKITYDGFRAIGLVG